MLGFFFLLYMERKLNIPIRLIKAHKSSKDDLEVLALSIGIKLLSENSIYNVVSIREVMKNFKVSYKTASRVLENAKKSELFSYNEKKNILFAYTYKSSEIKYSSRGNQYVSDYCYKFKIEIEENNELNKETDKKIKSISLQDLVKELRRSLILNAIHVKQMRQLRLHGDKKTIDSTLVSYSQQHLANMCGYSRSTTNRVINSMVKSKDNKVLNKKNAEVVILFNSISEGSINEFKQSHPTVKFHIGKDCGIKVIPCSYGISDGKVESQFKHVIYNHKKRIEKKDSYVLDPYDR